LDAVHQRHPDVDEHDVGSVVLDHLEPRQSVARLADDLDPGTATEDHRKPAPYQRVVVDDDDPDRVLAHVCCPGLHGSQPRRVKVVVSSTTVSVPPASSARSRRPTRPRPEPGVIGIPSVPTRWALLTATVTPSYGPPDTRTETCAPTACLRALVSASWTIR